MPTKPIVQPLEWASDAVYTTGPFIGQPQKVVPAPAVAAEGHRPGSLFPTAAEHENSQQNRITQLARWLFLGTFDPDPDAHVVETDGTGRAGLHGLDVVNGVDETAVNITASNTLAPGVLIDSPGLDSVRVQIEVGNTDGTAISIPMGTGEGATGISISMSDSGTGGQRGVKIVTAGGTTCTPLECENNGDGFTALFNTITLANSIGAYFLSNRAVAATFEATGALGTSMVIVPRAGMAVIPGALIISNVSDTIEFYDNGSVLRRVWSTEEGLSLAPSTFTAAVTAAFGIATVVQSLNYTFVAGRRYKIWMGCRVGRDAGSTRDAQINCTVGGVALGYSGNTLQLFQGGAAGQIEATFSSEDIFTAGASGALAVVLQVTPINGAGNVQADLRGITIVGHFD